MITREVAEVVIDEAAAITVVFADVKFAASVWTRSI
jgi:hypothetical protein